MSKSFMSPLLSSSLEVMEHAIEHLKMGTERDMKFAVQHADNAVELILKDLARSKRIRLMTKNNQSISYYDCINKIQAKGFEIPELTDIDLLHYERNSIYHLGNQPSREKAEWLVYDVALKFIERICKDELKFDIITFSPHFKLSKEVKEEIEETKSEIVNMYLVDALNAFDSKDYSDSIIGAYSGLEAFFKEFSSEEIRSPNDMLRIIDNERVLSLDLALQLDLLRNLRNKAAHGGLKATKQQAKLALDVFQNVTEDFSKRISKKETRRKIRKRLLPEHYENWEKMFAWTDENTKEIVKSLEKKILLKFGDVNQKTIGRRYGFYKGKPTTKSLFAVFMLKKKALKVRIRTDPKTFRDTQNWTKGRVYKGWYFKKGQEREFQISNRDYEKLSYATELIKQSYELAK